MVRKLATFLLLAVVIFIVPSGVLAKRLPSPSPQPQVISVEYEQVNPSDGSKFLTKRLQEKISLLFAFTPSKKADLYKKLVGVRLAELKHTIEKRQMAYFEKSTQRYFTTAGQLADLIVANNLKDQKTGVKMMLESHIPVIVQLRDSFDYRTAEWRFVEDDINYLKTYISRLPQ